MSPRLQRRVLRRWEDVPSKLKWTNIFDESSICSTENKIWTSDICKSLDSVLFMFYTASQLFENWGLNILFSASVAPPRGQCLIIPTTCRVCLWVGMFTECGRSQNVLETPKREHRADLYYIIQNEDYLHIFVLCVWQCVTDFYCCCLFCNS